MTKTPDFSSYEPSFGLGTSIGAKENWWYVCIKRSEILGLYCKSSSMGNMQNLTFGIRMCLGTNQKFLILKAAQITAPPQSRDNSGHSQRKVGEARGFADLLLNTKHGRIIEYGLFLAVDERTTPSSCS